MLPPFELRPKDFSRVMRGYNPSEVDEHINFIIEKYTELYRENDELERKLKAAYAKLDEIKTDEESIRNAMVNSQRASQKIMAEANDRADIILNTARKSCNRILADFKKKIQEERAILLALNTSITEFKEQLFKTYNSHISFIEDIKLLDEDEIINYALSDENFTAKVIQNIKNDIADISSDNFPSAKNNDEENADFAHADIVKQQTVARTNNVKDTIKQINKRLSENDSDSEMSEEKKYEELMKEIGITDNLNISKSDSDEKKELPKEE